MDDPAEASKVGGQPSALLISVGFLIGMFPQRGLWWLRDKVRIFSDVNPDMPKLPLDIIPGITHHHVVRFREISIDNCYILANHRLVPLLLQTPYDPEELIDWILRAKLYVHLPEAVNALRNIGVRDVLDLDKANDTDLRELAAKTELTEARLLNVRDSVKSDCQLHELKLLRERLADFGLLESAREFDSHVENET